MTAIRRPSPETLAAHGGLRPDAATGAILTPVQFSTTFAREPDNSYPLGRIYGRPDNPTLDAPEQLIAALEGGRECFLFASGMAAATSVFMALRPGAHVVAPRVMYWSLRNWLKGQGSAWGLQVTFADAQDPQALEAAVKPHTQLVWIESPANPTWVITDIAAAARIAHAAGALLAVDNTVATPLLTQPLQLGADIVMHSGTKYLNGHGDVLAGALVCGEPIEIWEKIRNGRSSAGAILGSMEAWLLLRGMRTLPLRLERACRSASLIAERFDGDPRVARVLYPGLPGHPGHHVAARQMRGIFGGMLSLEVEGGAQAAIAAAARVRLWTRATSFGGLESLIEHRASIEGPGSPTPPALLRLAVGAEKVEELIADLDQALGST